MSCDYTQKQRIRWHATTAERLRREAPELAKGEPLKYLTRDRVEVLEPMWVCGAGQRVDVRCSIFPCASDADFECDGCDQPICRAHTINRGMQDIQFDTGIDTPGWDLATVQDTYDLCPFCTFDAGKKAKP